MQIETYEIEEANSSEASVMAADGEAKELIERLGLAGQQTLLNPETGTRFQYPPMTAQQILIFRLLFPMTSEVTNYSAGIIPVRVLQVIAHCKEFPQVQYLEVWHARSAKEDPILVGREAQWKGVHYMLARWGDSLLSFDALKTKALPLLRAKAELAIKKCESDVRAYIGSLDAYVNNAIETGTEINPRFYE